MWKFRTNCFISVGEVYWLSRKLCCVWIIDYFGCDACSGAGISNVGCC